MCRKNYQSAQHACYSSLLSSLTSFEANNMIKDAKVTVEIVMTVAIYICYLSAQVIATRNLIIPKGTSKDEVRSMLLNLPFREVVCARSQAPKALYISTVSSRPEWQGIQWDADDNVKLAEQLWTLHSEKADMFYHKNLKPVLISMLKLHGVNPEASAEVMTIITKWLRLKNKKDFEDRQRLLDITETEEQKAKRRIINNRACKQRWIARKEGLCMPLLTYIKSRIEEARIRSLSPEDLYSEALKYRCMYPSGKVFLSHLRVMWTKLGIDDAYLYKFNRDKRNFDFWKANTSGSTSSCLNKEQEKAPLEDVSTIPTAETQSMTDEDDNIFADLELEPLPKLSSQDFSAYDFWRQSESSQEEEDDTCLHPCSKDQPYSTETLGEWSSEKEQRI